MEEINQCIYNLNQYLYLLMSLIQDNLTPCQKTVKEYMEKHMITEIINSMLNTLIHARDEKPFIFMVYFIIK